MSDKEFTEMLNGKGTINFGGYILDCPDLTKEEEMINLM